MNTPSIAIIGAGMAGAACAHALHAAGFPVHLFDKSRGVGGRLCTRRGANWQADHGAPSFTATSADFCEQITSWIAEGVIEEWCPVLAKSSVSPWGPTDDICRYVGKPSMSAPVKALLTGLNVATQHTVIQLRQDEAGWQLATVEQGWLAQHYQTLVLALPAPQVIPLLANVCPSMSALAERAVMQPCWTVMAQFAEPLSKLEFEAALMRDGPIRWLARNNSKPGREGMESWVIQASAEWSQVHLEESPAEVATMLLDAFERLGGSHPVSMSAHRWRYADCTPEGRGSVWQPQMKVGLCGDWLYGGKVEGAWLSGRHLASQVLQSFAA